MTILYNCNDALPILKSRMNYLLFLSLFGIILGIAVYPHCIYAYLTINPGELDDLVVVILSQKNQFHSSQTEAKVQNWKTEFRSATKVQGV